MDEEAVSSVIGVILMVAITVILAAVIASFAFGLGSKAPKSAPSAQLSLSDHTDPLSDSTGSDNMFTISHLGGDALNCENTKILVFYLNDTSIGTMTFNSSTGQFTASNIKTHNSIDSRFDPGDSIIVEEDGPFNLSSGEIIKVKVMDTTSNQPILDGQVQVL